MSTPHLHVALQWGGGGEATLTHAAFKWFAGAGSVKKHTGTNQPKSKAIFSPDFVVTESAVTCVSSDGSSDDQSGRKLLHTPDNCTSYLLDQVTDQWVIITYYSFVIAITNRTHAASETQNDRLLLMFLIIFWSNKKGCGSDHEWSKAN